MAALELLIASPRLEVDDEVPVRLRVTDTTGGIRSAESVRVWSSDASIAVIDEARMVIRAFAPGVVHVYAQSIVDGVPGVSATQPIAVHAPAAVRIDAEPAQIDLEEGATVAVIVHARDRRGRAVPDAQVVWTSESVTVATVGTDGVVRGLSIGSGMICARVLKPDGASVETRIPVLVRPNRSVSAVPEPTSRPEPPSLRAPIFTPVSPTAPLPRPDAASAPPSVTPVAPTLPLPRPARAAVLPNSASAAVAPPLHSPASGSTPPSRRGVADGRVGQTEPARSSERVAASQTSGAEQGYRFARWRGSRGLLIGGGLLVATIAVWALTKSLSSGDEPPPSASSETPTPPPSAPTPTTLEARASGVQGAGAGPSKQTTTAAPAAAPQQAIIQPSAAPRAPIAVPSATQGAIVQAPGTQKPAQTAPAGTGRSVAVEFQKQATPAGGTAEREPRQPSASVMAPTPVPEISARRPEPAKVVELADAGDLRNQAELFLGRLRAGAERNAELAAFFGDGADQKVVVVGAPAVVSETGGRTEAQFEIRLTKYDGGGRRMTRLATVTLDVVKRDGTVSTSSTSVSSLRSPK